MAFIADLWQPNPNKHWDNLHSVNNGIYVTDLINNCNISLKDSNYLETYFILKKSPQNKLYLPADILLTESCSCYYNTKDSGHKITCVFERKNIKSYFLSNCCLGSDNVKKFKDNHCSDRMYEILAKIEKLWKDGCILLIHN